jgi:hypothetical protein
MGRQTLRSRYFQEIAQTFFDLRGAPFVLSSTEIAAISSWEETGIPLRIVLEGIHRAFEKYRVRHVGGRKMSSLSFCNTEVLKAFAEFRDRGVGLRSKKTFREEKKKRLRDEVERFLQSLSAEVGCFKDLYEEALRVLSRKAAREEELEKMEEKAEDLILHLAQEEDKAEAERRVKAEWRGRPDSEVGEIYKIQLAKLIREKYRIPHLSLFYY